MSIVRSSGDDREEVALELFNGAGCIDEAGRLHASAGTKVASVEAEVGRLYAVVFAARNFLAEDRLGGSVMRAADRRLVLDGAVREWLEAQRG